MGQLSLYAVVGLCIGFLWGIGCSLAILYSIYLGGYRAAVRDFQLDPAPERLRRALAKVAAGRPEVLSARQLRPH